MPLLNCRCSEALAVKTAVETAVETAAVAAVTTAVVTVAVTPAMLPLRICRCRCLCARVAAEGAVVASLQKEPCSRCCRGTRALVAEEGAGRIEEKLDVKFSGN